MGAAVRTGAGAAAGLALAGALLALAGCAGEGGAAPAPGAAAADAFGPAWNTDAATTYELYCVSCHGPAKAPDGRVLAGYRWAWGRTAPQVAAVIAHGVDEAGMPGFGESLGAGGTRALADWLVGLRDPSAAAAPAVLPAAPARRTEGPFRTEEHAFVVETVVEPLETPWSLTWLPDGRMLVTERPGRLRVIGPDGQPGPPVEGLPPVRARGQGGLLDVVLHPKHVQNGWIYLTYSGLPEGRANVAMTTLERGKLAGNRWTEREIVWQADAKFATGRTLHYGSKIAFDRDGFLFFTVGERGQQDNAQDLAHPAGKVHRLHDDGRVPADNPYVGRADAYPSVWSYGHRNPQGLVWLAEREELWLTEHGPRGGDELNWVRPKLNFGWPLVCWGINYNGTPVSPHQQLPGIEDPAAIWTPSIAPSGLAEYRGSAFPAWEGQLFAGGLVLEELHRVVLDGFRPGKVVHRELVLKGLGRIRDVRLGPDGLLYLALNDRADEKRGRIVRLRPAP